MNTKRSNRLGRSLAKITVFALLFIACDRLVSGILTRGLYDFFGLKETTEIAFIGHSHLMLSIDHQAVQEATGKTIAKYTRAGVNIADRDLMIDHLFEKCPKLNLVVYGVDAWMFTGEGLSENSHALFYPFMDTPEIDDYIHQHASLSDYWQRKIIKTTRFDERLVSAAFRGFMNNWENLKYGTIDTIRLKKEIKAGQFRPINSTQANRELFELSLNKMIAKNISVVLLYTPTVDYYNNTNLTKFREEIAYFRQLADTLPTVDYVEYLEPWSHEYKLFFDPIHMNPEGQRQVTASFSEYLKVKLQ